MESRFAVGFLDEQDVMTAKDVGDAVHRPAGKEMGPCKESAGLGRHGLQTDLERVIVGIGDVETEYRGARRVKRVPRLDVALVQLRADDFEPDR